jgi:hypothetical protein
MGANGGDVGEWLVNKNRDLRERTERDDGGSMRGGMDQKSCDTAALESLEGQVRNRLHVKQSIDHALDTFKAHSYSGLYMHVHTRTLTSGGTNASTGGSLNRRRIHSTPPHPTRKCQGMKKIHYRHLANLPYSDLPLPFPALHHHHHPRPHPAGQDASPFTEPSSLPRAPPRKLGSKYSTEPIPEAGDDTSESPYVHSSSSFSTPPPIPPICTPLPPSSRAPRSNLLLASESAA